MDKFSNLSHKDYARNPQENQIKYFKKYLKKFALPNCTQNPVDPEWEFIDPPNIHVLKEQFDNKFFQRKLALVKVKWSINKHMYHMAGNCIVYESSQFGKCAQIRLSYPLLKFRPRKYLVETLLHEMIHAYIYISNIRESDHGPNFLKIMEDINRQAGTDITVYHKLIEETRLYIKHWWKCDGPCKDREPDFGYVMRRTNRAPNKNDSWFAEHQQNCGGNFIKIEEWQWGEWEKKNFGTTNLSNIDQNTLPSTLHGFNGVVTKVPTPAISTIAVSGQTLGSTGHKRSHSLDQFESPLSKKSKITTLDDQKSSQLTHDEAKRKFALIRMFGKIIILEKYKKALKNKEAKLKKK